MHYFIYKTTNMIDGKYYIGKHETNNIDDGYLGSGIRLINAIRKYGKENFKREIVCICCNSKELSFVESIIVNEDVVLDPLCYNIALGGQGGCIVLSEGHPLRSSTIKKIRSAANSNENKKRLSELAKENHKTKRIGMYGKKQSDFQKKQVALANSKPKSKESVANRKQSMYNTFSNPDYVHPNLGTKRTEEQKSYMRSQRKNIKKVKCPHCASEMDPANYARYHGDKCKVKNDL